MARQDPVSHLRRFPDGPPPGLEEEILALGEAVLPALEAVIDGAVAETPEALAAGSAAAALYARIAQERALPRLVDLVLTAPLDGPMHTAAQRALRRVDAAAVVAAILAAPIPPEREPYALEILVRAGAAPESVRDRLAALLDRQPYLGARLARYHGDPGLLPAIRAAFDELPLSGILDDEIVETGIALYEALAAHGDDGPRYERLRRGLQISITLREDEVAAQAAAIVAIDGGLRR